LSTVILLGYQCFKFADVRKLRFFSINSYHTELSETSFHLTSNMGKTTQLPENLPQLQNLMKRDPASYRSEVNVALKQFLN